MKKLSIKRTTAIMLALAIALTLSACTRPSADKQTAAQSGGTSGKVFSEPVPIKIAVGSHPSWPYDPNWLMWKLFREKTGADLQIQAIPASEMATKINLMMASRSSLPDLLFLIGDKVTVDMHAPTGAFVSISDNLDKMPNYKKFWDSVPEQERNDSMMQRVSGDGKIYFPPNYGIQTVGNMRAWLYRKDIFDKNNLKTPETLDEMYDVALKLKKLYPDSYPICIRNGLTNISVIGPEWKPYFTYGPYYDYNEEKWHYGAAESTMKEIVEYYIKLRSNGLVPPDFLTISSKSWEELIMTGRGFMMPEYLLRIDFFNGPARQMNPEFNLSAMKPPRANTPTGQNKIARFDYELTGYVVCNSGDQKRIDNALKLLDWMYSDEGCEFMSWGEQDKTYKVVNGKKMFIKDEAKGETVYAKYGIGTPGLYQRVETAANEALYSDEQGAQGKIAKGYQEMGLNPFYFLPFDKKVSAEQTDLYTAINSYSSEMLCKFILGQEPMSKWDAFQSELKGMGVDRLLELYTEMYDRVKNSNAMKSHT